MASTISTRITSNALTQGARLRINDLNADTTSNASYIEANVALIWPYSSSTRQLSLLLAEEDILLREAKGQLKVTFHGACAKEVAKTRVGIGDKVKLGLDQVELVGEHDVLSTPGRKVEFDLRVRKSVTLKILSPKQGVQIVDYDALESLPSSPRTSQADGEIDIAKTGVVMESVPALRTSGRLASNSFVNSFVDPFAEEDGYTESRGRKRTKFARHSGAWRLADTSDEEITVQPLPNESGFSAIEMSGDKQPAVLTNEASPMQSPVPDVVEGMNRDSAADAVLNDQLLGDVVQSIEKAKDSHDASSLITVEDEDSVTTPRLQAVPSSSLPFISPLVERSQHVPHLSDRPSELDASYQPEKPDQPLESLSYDAGVDALDSGATEVDDSNVEAEPEPKPYDGNPQHVDLDLLQQQIDMEHAANLQAGSDVEVVEDEEMYGPPLEQRPYYVERQLEVIEISELAAQGVSKDATMSIEAEATEPDAYHRDALGKELSTPQATQIPVIAEHENYLVQQSTITTFHPTPVDSQSSHFGFDGIQDDDLRRDSMVPDDLALTTTVDPTSTNRASDRLLNKPPVSDGLFSEYFTPQKATARSNAAEISQEPESSPVMEPALGSPRPMQTVSHTDIVALEDFEAQKTAQRGTVTPLSYYAPLASLTDHFGQLVDVMALCTATSTIPERAKTGPKDFHTSLQLADGSLSIHGNAAVTAQLFRPRKSALPDPKRGDVVLLRNVKVRTQAHKPLLVSCDESAWAVFHPSSSEMPVEVAGPPVEYDIIEQARVDSLMEWWSDVGQSRYPNIPTESPQDAQQGSSGIKTSKVPALERLDPRRSPRRPRTINSGNDSHDDYVSFYESLSPSPSSQPQSPSSSHDHLAHNQAPTASVSLSASPVVYSPHYESESGGEAIDESQIVDHEIVKSDLDIHQPQILSNDTPKSSPARNDVADHPMSVQSLPDGNTSITSQDAYLNPASNSHPGASTSSATTTSGSTSLRNGATSASPPLPAAAISAAPPFLAPITPTTSRPRHHISPSFAEPNSAQADLGSTVRSATTITSKKKYKRRSISLIHELRDGTQYVDVEEEEVISVSGSETGSDIVKFDENGNQEGVGQAPEHESRHEEDEHIDGDAEEEAAIPTSPAKKRGRPPKQKSQDKKPASSTSASAYPQTNLSQAGSRSHASGGVLPRVTRSKTGNGDRELPVHELRDGTEYTDAMPGQNGL